MRRLPGIVLVMGIVALVTTLPVFAEKPAEKVERNRQVLEQVRSDPEKYARLIQDLKAFLNLSPDQQDRLRQLDKDLQKMGPGAYDRLNRVLTRYADWMERLPESDRKLIESAASSQERIQRIKEIRERQWVERLPKALRDQVQAAQGPERANLIKKFRQEENKRRQEWQVAIRHWDELMKGQAPTRLAELQPPVHFHVEKVLMQRLSRDDASRLEKAEGQWPQYLQTIVELSEKYVPFPGPAHPKHFSDLPKDVQERLSHMLPNRPRMSQQLKNLDGKWPEYPLFVNAIFKRANATLPRQLGPSKPAEFADGIQKFIKDTLTPEEKAELRRSEGHWPDYPRTLLSIANRRGATVPGMLPGPKQYWDKYKKKGEATALSVPE
jgi:hypothetical protein